MLVIVHLICSDCKRPNRNKGSGKIVQKALSQFSNQRKAAQLKAEGGRTFWNRIPGYVHQKRQLNHSVQICPLNPSRPSKFINVHLLFTISIQNQLFCCENIGIDYILQAIQYEKLHSPKLFKKKVWIPFRRI